MPATTGAFSSLLAPGLRKVFFQTLRERPEVYSRVFNMRGSKRNYEDDLEMAGLGTAPEKLEGDSVAYQNMIQGSIRRYTHKTYGLGFRVTMEMMEDDLYGPMKRSSRELAKGHRNARETVSANVLNNGTNATLEPGFKSSEALFADSHTLLGGGTQDNLLAADLGVTSLEAAIILLDNLVDERGIPIAQAPSMLVVPVDSQFIAEQLTQSDRVPFSANNEPNVFRTRGIQVVVWKHLTDTDSFFLLSDEHDLNFFERMAYRFQSGDDFDSGDAKFKGVQRFSVGHGDYRGAVGSYGAA